MHSSDLLIGLSKNLIIRCCPGLLCLRERLREREGERERGRDREVEEKDADMNCRRINDYLSSDRFLICLFVLFFTNISLTRDKQ